MESDPNRERALKLAEREREKEKRKAMADRRRILPSSGHQPYIRSGPGVEEEHEPRQKSSEARADRQHRQAGIRPHQREREDRPPDVYPKTA